MAIQKKHGKGRLDKWYKLAKEKGYRARSAFKLIQLNKKYGFLGTSKVLLDLCAAPGSWCQVAAEAMPANSMIIGVDLAPIRPIPKVITFQGDITTEKCSATIRHHLKTWKADTVLHDGAPNVGTAWAQDSFNQAELSLQAMKLATEFLIEGGTFVTKVFRSKDFNALLWVLNQLFANVETTKPPSSRNVSAEIFVVCRGFKAPQRIDPRFLDPRSVFAEISGATVNHEARIYKPEVRKRKREGYEEGDYTQFTEIPASDYIHTSDPIAVLGGCHKLTIEQPLNEDLASALLERLPETTAEIRNCCADLKVLGRKDFKLLLKWRLQVRKRFGLASMEHGRKEATEVIKVESMNEGLSHEEERQAMRDKENAKKKREQRNQNERKKREMLRMRLNMVAPVEIGLEHSEPLGDDSIFSLKSINRTESMQRFLRGRMIVPFRQDKDHVYKITHTYNDDQNDTAEDELERQLDNMYDTYRECKTETDAKYRAKKMREYRDDDEWEGLSDSIESQSNASDEVQEEDSTDDEVESYVGLSNEMEDSEENGLSLSKRATMFFNQDIFRGITEAALSSSAVSNFQANASFGDSALSARTTKQRDSNFKSSATQVTSAIGSKLNNLNPPDEENELVDAKSWEIGSSQCPKRSFDIDIVTAEAMTLAYQLATGEKTSHGATDDGYNKRSFRDRDGLPEWFLDDELKHDRPIKPVTKAAAQAIKEKMRAFNARPIKKVREARARKKLKAAQKFEKLKKKSDMLANDEGLTEKEKADNITRLLGKAARKKPAQPAKLVVARGLNRGIQGRPKGVRGRYRMVDPRMKKELRAQKRILQCKKR